MKSKSWILAEIIAITAILGLAAFLRLANVGDNPGFYSDEGTAINIAQNLMQGKVQYLAIGQSTLLEAKLPPFSLILAGVFDIWGAGIETLRTFTGLLGVLSIFLLYLALRTTQKKGTALALLSAFLLAIYPKAILYNRLGFSYNLLTPLLLLSFWGLLKYLDNRRPAWLVLAALALGLGCASDLLAISFIPIFVLVVSTRSWRALLWSLGLVALPFAVYTGVMLASVPQAFLFDLGFTLTRTSSVPFIAQVPLAFLNFAYVLQWDGWVLPAVVGMFLLKPQRLRYLVLLFYLLAFLLVGGKLGLVGTGYYYASPLFPYAAVGIAGLILAGTPFILRVVRSGLEDLFQRWRWQTSRAFAMRLRVGLVALVSALALFLVVVAPLLFTVYQMTTQVYQGLQTSIDWALVDPGGARQVAAFVNQRVNPGDLVIASPATAWMFDANVTDFQQAVAAKGIATVHFPGDIPPDRFVFPVDEQGARFVVIDRIWTNWGAIQMPAVKDLIAEVEHWPAVFTDGEYIVYENPGNG